MLENLKRRSFFGWLAGVGAATAVAASVVAEKPVVSVPPDPSLPLVATPVESPRAEDLKYPKEWIPLDKLDAINAKERVRNVRITSQTVAAEALFGINMHGYERGVKFVAPFVIEHISEFVPNENVKYAEAEVIIGDHELSGALDYGPGSVRQRIWDAASEIAKQLSKESENDLVCPRTTLPNGVEWSDQISDNYLSVRVIRAYDMRGNIKITKIQVPYAYRRDTGERAWAESDRQRKEAHEAKLAEIRHRGNRGSSVSDKLGKLFKDLDETASVT